MKMKSNRKLKRAFSMALLVLLSALIFALPCFAWTSLPVDTTDQYAFAYKVSGTNTYSMYAYSHEGTVYGFAVDGRYWDYFSANPLSNMVYVPVGSNAPTEAQAYSLVQYNIEAVRNSQVGINYRENMEVNYDNGYQTGYNIGYVEGATTQNYYTGYEDGFEVGYVEGKADGLNTGYNTGYTEGATDTNYMKNTLITIFSSPYYVLNEVFNFEIFGVSVAGVIMFIISIVVVGFVIKTIT